MSLHYFDETSTKERILRALDEDTLQSISDEEIENLVLVTEDIFESAYNLGLESGRDEMVGVKLEASNYDQL